jgi:hypothetical protein
MREGGGRAAGGGEGGTALRRAATNVFGDNPHLGRPASAPSVNRRGSGRVRAAGGSRAPLVMQTDVRLRAGGAPKPVGAPIKTCVPEAALRVPITVPVRAVHASLRPAAVCLVNFATCALCAFRPLLGCNFPVAGRPQHFARCCGCRWRPTIWCLSSAQADQSPETFRPRASGGIAELPGGTFEQRGAPGWRRVIPLAHRHARLEGGARSAALSHGVDCVLCVSRRAAVVTAPWWPRQR